jgi:hypothetical protein
MYGLNAHLDFNKSWVKFDQIEFWCNKAGRKVISVIEVIRHDLFLGDYKTYFITTDNE